LGYRTLDYSSRQNEDRLGPCRAFVTAGTRDPAQRSEADRSSPVRVFLLEGRALSNNTLNKRLRLLGIDTKTDHCAHGFRTTFSTLSHHEEIKDAKAWDGDVVELQLAHLDNSTVEGLYKKHGPLALIGSRTKLMQHWADRIDHWLDPKKVMPIKGGAQG
jgi:integrase